MRTLLNILCSVTLLTMAATGFGQEGPRVPSCEGCPTSLTERPYPRPGMWWDPARNGTGMNLEAQNGVVVGTWHGFDESGAPMWYQFAGGLESIPEGEDGYWRVEAPLTEFSGGNCIDCPYQPSEVAGTRGTIELKVLQRNLISYRIDGGEEFRMQPLVWGTPMPDQFPESSDHGQPIFPDDERVSEWSLGYGMTPWVLVFRVPNPPDRAYLASSAVYWVSVTRRDTDTPYMMNFFQVLGPELYVPVNMQCGRVETLWVNSLPESLRTSLGPEPICILRRVIGPGTFTYYVTALGNVGDEYFVATAEDGSAVEGHRLLYR
jgi:hypothetical protein